MWTNWQRLWARKSEPVSLELSRSLTSKEYYHSQLVFHSYEVLHVGAVKVQNVSYRCQIPSSNEHTLYFKHSFTTGYHSARVLRWWSMPLTIVFALGRTSIFTVMMQMKYG
jgi:hypothetical protein